MTTAIPNPQSSLVLFELSKHPVLEITGEDADRYLQGRLTQEVKSLAPLDAIDSLFLTPQGKVIGQLCLIKAETGFLAKLGYMESKADTDHCIEGLLQFKVADRVSIEENPNLTVFAVRGTKVSTFATSLGWSDFDEAKHLAGTKLGESEGYAVKIVTKESSGLDIIVPQNAKEKLLSLAKEIDSSAATSDEKTFSAFQTALGIFEVDSSLSEKVIATELPHSHLIAFNKGCYAGQETVEMSIARGRPNRCILHLVSDCAENISPQMKVLDQAGTEVGEVLRTAKLTKTKAIFVLCLIKSKFAESPSFIINDGSFTPIVDE